jgi:FkbM family methyltransferase
MTAFNDLAQLPPGRLLRAGEPVWIFGTGIFGRALASACHAQGVPVAGFVQTRPSAAECAGQPVRAWNELSAQDRQRPMLIGIYNRDMPFDGLAALARESGCDDVRLPFSFYGQFATELGWRYWLADPSFLAQHADDLARTHHRLADETSRECLRQLVQFRVGRLDTYGAFTHPNDAQYFNDLTLPALPKRPLRYLDGGAYNGDTLVELCAKAEVAEAWLFEPDTANFAKLTQTIRSKRLPGLCLPLALSDRYTLLRFRSGLGEAGNVAEDGDEGIATVAIDDLLAGQAVDFIKLDVEGSEVPALHGARQTLVDQCPVLALSAYHRPEDLWVLPDLIEELVPGGYEFHLRQHTHNSFDLVLYAIPKR